jgi:hypothetical protein
MQWRWAGQVSINKYAVEGRRSEETGGFNTTIKMHDPELFDGFAKELLWTWNASSLQRDGETALCV